MNWRLFITTGNYNLLNSLTLIKQLNKKSCEDVLIIISHVIKKDFNYYNKLIASAHNFKKVIILDGPDFEKKHKYFIKHKLYDFDEIYASSMGSPTYLTSEYYPLSNKNLVDEGVCSLIYQTYINYSDYNKIYMHNYSDKLDYFGFNQETAGKIKYLDKEIFKNITENIEKRIKPIIDVKKDKKTILICGTCGNYLGLSEEQYADYIKKIVTQLKSFGYNVAFKPHPKEVYKGFDNLDIQIVKTPIPLELFSLTNLVAVISFCSLAATQIYYLRNVPGFQFTDFDYKNFEIPPKEKLNKVFFFEYTASHKELLFDCKNMSCEELKELLLKKAEAYLSSKPKMSVNPAMTEYAKELEWEYQK